LHTGTIHALSWSPDGRRVASASGDGTVSVWDPARGEELFKLDAPQSEVSHLLWSADARRLAAATVDGAIHIWDASAGFDFVESDGYLREQVHDRLSQAIRLWELGSPNEALALYEQTVEESNARPDSLAPWVVQSIRARARALDSGGRYEEAIMFFRWSLRLNGDDAGALDSLARILANCPNPTFRDPTQAVQLARHAVKLAPLWSDVSNILGVAHYRAGDWRAAVTALEKSMDLRNGGNSYDWFFLAMAHWRLAELDELGELEVKVEARNWYNKAIQWMDKNERKDAGLRRIREEAELLGLKQ
jgi:tetratricopeptide (TPR) repeat protein